MASDLILFGLFIGFLVYKVLIQAETKTENNKKYRPPTTALFDPGLQFVSQELRNEPPLPMIEWFIQPSIQRDFIDSWTSIVSPKNTSISIRTYRGMLLSLYQLKLRIEKFDLVNFVAAQVVPLAMEHLQEYKKAEAASRTVTVVQPKSINQFEFILLQRYKNGELHQAVRHDEDTEKNYLRAVVKSILPFIFPDLENGSDIVSTILREVLVCNILHPIIKTLSDPDYINQTIDTFATRAIEDLRMVKKLREALERPMFTTSSNPGRKPKTFDEFLKVIKQCSSVEDAKRIRNHLVAEIRKWRIQIQNHRKDDLINGKKVSDINTYINRLFVAKKRAEKRIIILGGSVYRTRSESFQRGGNFETTLKGILENKVALTYFQEFMKSSKQQQDILAIYFDCDSFLSQKEITREECENLIKKLELRAETLAIVLDAIPRLKYFLNEKKEEEFKMQVATIKQFVFQSMEDEDAQSFFATDLYYRYLSNPEEQLNSYHVNVKTSPSVTDLRSESEFVDEDLVEAVENKLGEIIQLKPHENHFDNLSDRESSTENDDLKQRKELHELEENLDNLKQEMSVVKTLIERAQRRKSVKEENVLRKSLTSLESEYRILSFQKDQLAIEESENTFTPGCFDVFIPSFSITKDEVGKEYALFTIEINKLDKQDPSKIVGGWLIFRRYSEFFALDQKLRLLFPIVSDYNLPQKSVKNLFKLPVSFVEERRMNLELYLKKLSSNLEICTSSEFKSFMCNQQLRDEIQIPEKRASLKNSLKSIISTLKRKSDASSIHETESIPQSPGRIQRILSRAASPISSDHSSKIMEAVNDEMSDQPLRPNYSLPVTPAVAEPICDLFIELFELKDKNRWLRRNAVTIILQQFLGGTIERKVIENIKYLTDDEMLSFYLTRFSESFWPNGHLYETHNKRTEEQMQKTKLEVQHKLISLFPGGMVGRHNAKKGAARLFDIFQSEVLNKHILYSLLDDILLTLFPEIDWNLLKKSLISPCVGKRASIRKRNK